MRALSARQASSCEHATGGRCRCRCGGTFHGTSRAEVTTLPAIDPHYPIAEVRRLEARARGLQLRLEMAS